MASIICQNRFYLLRFRIGRKSYKRSFQAHSVTDAWMAFHAAERVLLGLSSGLMRVPDGVDPGDFVASGGVITAMPVAPPDASYA